MRSMQILRALNRPLTHTMAASPASISLGDGLHETGTTSLNTDPDSISWTVSFIDTGDGTSWVSASPSTGTGDTTITARTESANTGAIRHCTMRVTDDSDTSVYTDVGISQDAGTT